MNEGKPNTKVDIPKPPEKKPAGSTGGKMIDAKLQYLNELRYLQVSSPMTRDVVRDRIDRVCDSIETDLGIPSQTDDEDILISKAIKELDERLPPRSED